MWQVGFLLPAVVNLCANSSNYESTPLCRALRLHQLRLCFFSQILLAALGSVIGSEMPATLPTKRCVIAETIFNEFVDESEKL